MDVPGVHFHAPGNLNLNWKQNGQFVSSSRFKFAGMFFGRGAKPRLGFRTRCQSIMAPFQEAGADGAWFLTAGPGYNTKSPSVKVRLFEGP